VSVALGQLDRAACPRGHRLERPVRPSLGERIELGAGHPRRLQIVDREHHLDVGGQDARSLAGLRRLRLDPSDRRLGSIDFPLSQPHQSEARLRLPAMPACLAVGRLRAAEVAAEPVDLPPVVAGLACRARVLSAQAALGCSPRLVERLRPGSVQLHDLGAMREAAPGEGDEVGLALAPA
jgi:hypothetical protein